MMNSDMDQIPAGRWSQNILRNVNAMLDREIAYKVSTLPTINTSVRGLWRLATSNEVLGLLSILCLLIFAIQVLASINGTPIPKVTAVVVFLSPVLITFISWMLIALRSQVSGLFGSGKSKPKIQSLPNTFFAAAALHVFGSMLNQSQAAELGSQSAVLSGTTEIITFSFLVIAYTFLAEAIHVFVFKYLVPFGGPNWTKVTQLERKPMKDWLICRFWNALRVKSKTDHILIGKQQVAIDELISISAQGNYVQVTCKTIDYFERVPFSKAVQALPNEFGMMLHRSNWVACSAIESFSRHGDECTVKLTNGASVSVARTRVKDVSQLLSDMEFKRTEYCDLP